MYWLLWTVMNYVWFLNYTFLNKNNCIENKLHACSVASFTCRKKTDQQEENVHRSSCSVTRSACRKMANILGEKKWTEKMWRMSREDSCQRIDVLLITCRKYFGDSGRLLGGHFLVLVHSFGEKEKLCENCDTVCCSRGLLRTVWSPWRRSC